MDAYNAVMSNWIGRGTSLTIFIANLLCARHWAKKESNILIMKATVTALYSYNLGETVEGIENYSSIG